eukprot:2779338-Rhodomonas_salina.3
MPIDTWQLRADGPCTAFVKWCTHELRPMTDSRDAFTNAQSESRNTMQSNTGSSEAPNPNGDQTEPCRELKEERAEQEAYLSRRRRSSMPFTCTAMLAPRYIPSRRHHRHRHRHRCHRHMIFTVITVIAVIAGIVSTFIAIVAAA